MLKSTDIQTDLGQYFIDFASRHYDAEHGVISSAQGGMHSGPLTGFYDDMIMQRRLMLLDQPHVQTISEELASRNIAEFRFVAEGETAQCYRSGNIAVRVGPMPKTMPPPRSEWGLVRASCPLTLQPSMKFEVDDAKVMFEVLPYFKVMPNEDIPDEFKELIPKILAHTAFFVNNEWKDLAVAPDGTPIYVDPDAIVLDNFDRPATQRDYEQIRMNCEALGLPPNLSWVERDGDFKQQRFARGNISKPEVFSI